MTEESDYSNYTVTLKGGKGYDAPWVVIRGNSLEHIEDRLAAFADSGIPATVGRAAKALESGSLLGHKLDAVSDNKPVEPEAPKAKAPAKKAPAKKPAAKAEPKTEEPEAQDQASAEEAAEAPKKAPAKKAGGPPKPAWAS